MNSFANFDSRATSWNPSNALALADAAGLAYTLDGGQIMQTAAEWGFTETRVLRDDALSLQAFLSRRDDCLLLSFRGSDSLNNWTGNLHAGQLSFGSYFGISDIGQTHAGFTYGLAHRLWQDIITTVNEWKAITQPLWIAGHSLGGALAVLAAAGFYFSIRRPVSGIYTFGQPRVGDIQFALTFDSQLLSQHYRFVNAADIVPHVPPPSVPVFVPPHLWPPVSPLKILSYNHTGRVLMFDRDGHLSNSEMHWDLDVLNLSLMTLEERLREVSGEVNAIKDHALVLYRAKIQAYLDGGSQPELHW